MPTAPKLIAAILLSLTALLVALTYRLGYPEQTFKPTYYLLAAGVGGVVGWFTLGQKPYLGGVDSIMAGIRANIIMSVVGAIAFALVILSAAMHAIWPSRRKTPMNLSSSPGVSIIPKIRQVPAQ